MRRCVDTGATVFLNITQADRETSPSTDRQIAFGVQYKGPFTRANDVLGFAMGTSHVNSRVAADERLLNDVNGSNVPVQSSEYVAEAFYGWTPWLVPRTAAAIAVSRHSCFDAYVRYQTVFGLDPWSHCVINLAPNGLIQAAGGLSLR